MWHCKSFNFQPLFFKIYVGLDKAGFNFLMIKQTMVRGQLIDRVSYLGLSY